MIEVGAFIGEDRGVAEDEKAVGKSGGNIKLILLFGGQRNGVPLSVGLGAGTDVHGDVENLAFDDMDKLALRVRFLEM